MIRNNKTLYALRLVSETGFLCLFGFLLYQGSIEKWLLVFGFGAVASIFFSRFYCGWICPIHTLFRPLGALYAKLRLGRRGIPVIFRKPRIRYAVLVLFVPTMLLTKRMDLKLPHLALVTAAAVFITLFFEETFWHNRLCPYGTILGLTSRKAKKRMIIDSDLCISCGKCQKVCPAAAVDNLNSGKRSICKTDCLVCDSCVRSCPSDAIGYR